jgi:acyl carrier protein
MFNVVGITCFHGQPLERLLLSRLINTGASYPERKIEVMQRTRKQIEEYILKLLKDEFEIENPDLNINLTEAYEFDSIDAIALLEHVEDFIKTPLSQEEKKQAMEIRTINQICGFIESVLKSRS